MQESILLESSDCATSALSYVRLCHLFPRGFRCTQSPIFKQQRAPGAGPTVRENASNPLPGPPADAQLEGESSGSGGSRGEVRLEQRYVRVLIVLRTGLFSWYGEGEGSGEGGGLERGALPDAV